MFGKLLKYEFKSVGSWFFGLYGLAIALSLFLGIWLRFNITFSGSSDYRADFNSNVQGVFASLLFSLLLAVFITIFIATLLLIIRRFYNNIFGREGYLTLTLPVSTHNILLSKLAAALIWIICSCFVSLFSVFLLVAPWLGSALRSHYLSNGLSDLFNTLFNPASFLVSLSLLVSIISCILGIYFAASLGQLFLDNRILFAIVFYFLISIICSSLDFLLGSNGNSIDIVSSTNGYYHLTVKIMIHIIYSLFFYFGTHYIIKNKLNIQ
ncbi:hypothetical protein [Streptococcus macacae]|uniref:ABC transporter, ATP-binding family protein n=1 Tax=Streptococcus macacae NCTC 11558 TaxID=764298 RepID=G5JUG7_9STRE|nr:hypothetical protein [Streptococcus macacae]EHJ53276.1 ABC transporter, ATP-binding family protein [Streptococcus macacae NCTC 11558]SUN78609.1 ABC transporter permease [Streptococcus macacae NCTC 11558]